MNVLIIVNLVITLLLVIWCLSLNSRLNLVEQYVDVLVRFVESSISENV